MVNKDFIKSSIIDIFIQYCGCNFQYIGYSLMQQCRHRKRKFLLPITENERLTV